MPVELTLRDIGALLAAPGVRADILAGLNAAELGRRQFREIARVAGLVFQGYPGQPQSNRQLQASSGLLWDVFNEYDPDNLLLRQATHEVLDRQLEAPRLYRRARSDAKLRRHRHAADATDALRVSADRRAFPREADNRSAGGARGANGRRSRGRRAEVSVAVAAGKAILA